MDVALRMESVDRNMEDTHSKEGGATSLSARRAWIEMQESQRKMWARACRSPHGERG